jgi:hypothetical protein
LRTKLALSMVAISLLTLVPLVQAVTPTSSLPFSSGYAVYSVQVTGNGTSHDFSIKENVTPSSTSGESIVSLVMQGTQSNFTYSRFVNSSLVIFPFMPAITGNNFSYAGASGNMTANVAMQGTTQVTFNNQSYTMNEYTFSSTMNSVQGAYAMTGTVSTFPSDLIYSVVTGYNNTQITAKLTSTSLPLSVSSLSPMAQTASAGIGLSLVAGVVALSLAVKLRSKPQAPEAKPDHWVD